MVRQRQLRLAVAIAVCAIVLAVADGEGATMLEGEEAELPLGWIRERHDLGESQGEKQPGGPGVAASGTLTTSTSFSGTADAVSYTYKVLLAHEPTQALRELQGEELMGESMDVHEDAARVTLTGLQAGLEGQADMMGKVDRLTAVKVLMSLPSAKSMLQSNGLEDTAAMSLVQVEAGTGWGRRRRASQWNQNPVSKKMKQQQRQDGRKAEDNPAAAANNQQPAKVVVKKPAALENPMAAKMDPMEEAKNKADKAIEMAREKGDKANAKAEKEAKAAEKEADDKKKFELAEKRKHELTNKEEQMREKKMKDETEKTHKKAKEAAMKAENLAKAVKKAKEAAEKEQVLEKKKKKVKEAKHKWERKVMIEKAKEKAAKNTKEQAMKRIAELKAKFGAEGMKKKQEEKKLKHKHMIAHSKATEKAKKKTDELAKKTAEESKNKDEEEKALKAADEKKMKAAQEIAKKAEDERNDKAEKEGTEKKKREKALKEAAKRRIDEEKAAKNEKRKAMESSAQMAENNAKEQANKAKSEMTQKQKEEVELKKTREKKEKDAREVTGKKAQEVLRKVTREHADKVSEEKSSKAFEEQNHKEKQKKAEEGTQKILAGLKDFEESLAKARAKLEVKNGKYREIDPVETKHKTEAGNLSKVAKELAMKIKGESEEKPDPNTCDLGKNLESIKKKGLLTGSEGQCSVKCALKPNQMGIQAQCKLDGEKNTECQKLMYTRVQSLGSALMSEFDAYKKCEIEKKQREANGGSAEVPANGEEGEAKYLLGEGENSGMQKSMPKDVKDGVEVGDYIYTLKDLEDVAGTVSVAHAMDLLMKCNRDGPHHGPKDSDSDDDDDDMGESYSPKNAEKYNAEDGKKGDDSSLTTYCLANTISQTIKHVVGPTDGQVQYKCAAMNVEMEAYTADCNGGGAIAEFLQSAEAYHRNVFETYMTWKAKCVSLHNQEEQMEELSLLED